MMPLATVLASHGVNGIENEIILSLDQDSWQDVNFVMLCHWQWCQYHIMLMASQMAPLHSLVKMTEMW